MQAVVLADGFVNLQATLSSSTAGSTDPPVAPHHPITCATELTYHEDGSFACEHARVGGDDVRTQAAVDHSIALLLIELAGKL